MPRAKKQAVKNTVVVHAEESKAAKKARKPVEDYDALYKEWRGKATELQALEEKITRAFPREGLSDDLVGKILEVSLANKNMCAIQYLVHDYPVAAVLKPLFDDREKLLRVHCSVSDFIHPAAGRGQWPKEALPYARKFVDAFLHQVNPPKEIRSLLNYFLIWVSQLDPEFTLDGFGSFATKYGSASLGLLLIQRNKFDYIQNYAPHEDLEDWVRRTVKEGRPSTKYEPSSIVRFAQSKDLPPKLKDIIIDVLLEMPSQLSELCAVVKATGSQPADVERLAAAVARSEDLRLIKEFLRDFPTVDKQQFRDVVRKLLVPDPEQLVDAYMRCDERAMHKYLWGPFGVFMTGRGPW
jgi:hypothetical protein